MKNKIEQMIASWVDENQEYLINELKDFLRIPSLTGHEGEAQKFVKAQYEKLGMDVDVINDFFDCDKQFTHGLPILNEPGWEPLYDIRTAIVRLYDGGFLAITSENQDDAAKTTVALRKLWRYNGILFKSKI